MKLSGEWESLTPIQKGMIEKHQQCYPVKVGSIAKEFNLTVKSSTLSANISGEIREINNEVVIKINRHDVKTRQRYTLAHEIAHFLLHRHLLQEGISDDVLYRSAQSTAIEAEANRLAADIIMPLNLINLSTQKNIHIKNLETRRETIAADLDVSITALKIRLGVI